MKLFIFIVLIWLIYGVGMFCYTILEPGEIDSFACTPKEIYELHTNLNMFGCILLSFISFVINPVTVAIRLFYWIFHVRRRR